jgi:phosphoglycolate phosphatase
MSVFDAMLFDLDGTLIDTAPDMGNALNRLRGEEGLPPLTQATIRPHVSHGALALLKLGFGELEEARREAFRLRFLDIYREDLAVDSRTFDGIDTLLAEIENRGLRWGVVTNKPGWLTDPLLRALDLYERAACVVSGDTLAQRKPHPAPMHHACELADLSATRCIYVGDAARDIEAGKAAGMTSIVAAYGYIGVDENPTDWAPHGLVDHPEQLVGWLDGAV